MIWIALLLAGSATALVILTSWRHRLDMAELGTVSEQWLSEHRANDRNFSAR